MSFFKPNEVARRLAKEIPPFPMRGDDEAEYKVRASVFAIALAGHTSHLVALHAEELCDLCDAAEGMISDERAPGFQGYDVRVLRTESGGVALVCEPRPRPEE